VITIFIVILCCISSSVAAGFGGYYYNEVTTTIAVTSLATTPTSTTAVPESTTKIVVTSLATTPTSTAVVIQPVPVVPVVDTSNNIQYAKKVFIGRFAAKSLRLGLFDGKAVARKDDLTEPFQLMIQSAESKSGCIKYGDKVFIARSAWPNYRLSLTNDGFATEVKDNLEEPTQLVIQSADNNKSGCVQYGDKIHIARHMYPYVRLQLLPKPTIGLGYQVANELASGVSNDISEPTQLEIQWVAN
jgi:hypothetical protein